MAEPNLHPHQLAQLQSAFDAQLPKLAHDPWKLHHLLDDLFSQFVGPHISSFAPLEGSPGTMITITGSGFAPARWDNEVTVGGEPALVVSASADELRVITGMATTSGPVKVGVGANSAGGPVDFKVLDHPAAGDGGDGPPTFFEGAGDGAGAGVDPDGEVKTLVVLCRATDTLPTNPNTARNAVMTEFNEAVDFYDEVSYGRTDLVLDYTQWVDLSGALGDYVDSSINNISNPAGLNRIMAEAAQGAVDQGLDLDDYVAMAAVLFLDGGFIRAWGGWSASNFSYVGNGLNINLTADHALGLMAIGDNADWGRFAHEVAHNLVDATALLGEDIYSSDLIDPSVATAERFDLMGDHDSHPCFSAHFMDQLGYWNPSNVLTLDWNRNPFTQAFTIQAHGTTENSSSSRKHMVRIKVAAGLEYNVEVRQLNSTASLHFDTEIPVTPGDPGGVVVTKVFTDVVNVNQELRFVTLLHDPVTQGPGAVIEDPARGLTITVGGVVSTSPLTMDVTVAWAQTIGDNPAGTFDLFLTQAGVNWVSDDIWVDRQPFGLNPELVDGNTVATIERPRPGEINHLFAKVHNSGADVASDVKVTYYAVTPPGVGDNGAWSPIAVDTISTISAGGTTDLSTNWTPTLGAHTCLRAYASAQFGEVTGGNNSAQENVFHFVAPASSPPEPVTVQVAVRNPLDDKATLPVDVIGVPAGYVVHLPHRWLELPGKGERIVDLTVIPVQDIALYRREKWNPTAWIQLVGRVPHPYAESLEISDVPAFTHLPIGGITASVTPKYKAEIEIEKHDDGDGGPNGKDRRIIIYGRVNPGLAAQAVTVCVRVDGGELRTVDVLTETGGTFMAGIPLTLLVPGAQPWESNKYVTGKFEVWAETDAADDLAPARSKSVYFEQTDELALRRRRTEEVPRKLVGRRSIDVTTGATKAAAASESASSTASSTASASHQNGGSLVTP